MHPADLPILPLTHSDLADMDARLSVGQGADDDEDALSTVKLRRRVASALDQAVDGLDLESGAAQQATALVDGPGGRPPGPADPPPTAPAAPPRAPAPSLPAAEVSQEEIDTAPARHAIPDSATPPPPEERTVELTADQIEQALTDGVQANRGERVQSPAPKADSRAATPVRGLVTPPPTPRPTPAAADVSLDELEIPERSEDSLDDIVDDLVKTDRVGSARRRAQHRRGRLAWWQELFDAAWLELTPPRPQRAIEAEAALFARALQLKAGSRVLDVACGQGLHAIELAKLGCDVVGYDLSPDMVAAAERNARAAGVDATFLVDDMRAPEHLEGEFDAVMCVGTSFGYFDDGANVEALARMRAALKDQRGPLLIHGLNRDHAAARLPERCLWRMGEDIISEEADFNPITSRMTVHKQVVYSDGEVRDWNISIRLYAAHELRNLMRALEAGATRIAGPPRYYGRYLGPMCRELLVLGLWG